MKKIITIAIAALSPLYLFCQIIQTPGYKNSSSYFTKNQLLNIRNPLQVLQKNSSRDRFTNQASGIADIPKGQNISSFLLDSFVYYNYTSITDSSYDSKTLDYYDSEGNQNKIVYYIWNNTNKNWIPNYKYEESFNSDRNKTLEMGYTWADSSVDWIPSYKTEYGYDIYGHENLIVNYTRDNETNKLVESYKFVYTDDPSGRLIHDTTYIWNKVSEQWIEIYLYDYLSDTLSINYTWDPIRNQWYNWRKSEVKLNSSGYMISALSYAWDTTQNSWSVTTRDEVMYDSLWNETFVAEYSWINATNSWIGIIKVEYTYDGKQNVISESDYMWDYEGSKWLPYLKQENAYNGNNKKTMYIIYNWNTNSGLWHELDSTCIYFDSYGNETQFISYNTDNTGNEFLMTKGYFYYSDHSLTNSISKSQISKLPLIFPNPSNNDYVHIDIPGNQQGIANIFNTSGQLLKSVNVSGTNNEIPVNSFSKGIYFIQIVLNNQTYIQKLLIK